MTEPRRQGAAIVHAIRDNRLVTITVEKLNQHFISIPGQGNHAVAITGPVARIANPRRAASGVGSACVLRLAFDHAFKKSHPDAAEFVASDFLAFIGDHNSGHRMDGG